MSRIFLILVMTVMLSGCAMNHKALFQNGLREPDGKKRKYTVADLKKRPVSYTVTEPTVEVIKDPGAGVDFRKEYVQFKFYVETDTVVNTALYSYESREAYMVLSYTDSKGNIVYYDSGTENLPNYISIDRTFCRYPYANYQKKSECSFKWFWKFGNPEGILSDVTYQIYEVTNK